MERERLLGDGGRQAHTHLPDFAEEALTLHNSRIGSYLSSICSEEGLTRREGAQLHKSCNRPERATS